MNSARVKKAFDEAFGLIHAEAAVAAVALGFTPGKGMHEALERESRLFDGLKQGRYEQLPRALRARVRCAEIIAHLLTLPGSAANGRNAELELTYKLIDELQRELSIAVTLADRYLSRAA